jgi:spermidine/putrescine transport system substrate-binding protein
MSERDSRRGVHERGEGDHVPTRFSRRHFLAGAGALAGAAALLPANPSSAATRLVRASSAPKPKVDGNLNVFTWSTYIPPAVIKSFEKEYHVTVKQTYFSNLTTMIAKTASGLPFDAVVVGSTKLVRLYPYLQPVNHDSLKYWDEQVLPGFKVPPYTGNPKLDKKIAPYLAVPYAADGVGISWFTTHLGDTLPNSFDVFWQTSSKAKAKGHMYLWTTSQFTIAMALAKLGYSINSTEPKELNDAAQALLTIKPYLAGFTGTDISDVLANGEGWLEMAYSGNFYYTYTTSKPDVAKTMRFQRCKTSLIYGDTSWVMPKAAAHPGTAMLFFDWLLRPDNIAACVDYTGYVTATKAGVEAFAAISKKYPFLKIRTGELENPRNWIGTLSGSALQLWNETWTKITA